MVQNETDSQLDFPFNMEKLFFVSCGIRIQFQKYVSVIEVSCYYDVTLSTIMARITRSEHDW